MAGIVRFVSSRSVPPRPIAESHQLPDIIRMPSIMNPKPRPRMIPTMTGRLRMPAAFFATPVTPSMSQMSPVTRPAAYTAPGAMTSV